MSLEWLIVGGGIHGVHLATRLILEGKVTGDRLAIIDPGERLLARWRSCTAVTGMSHLRSPAVHNLDLASNGLKRFAGKDRLREVGAFATPGLRPTLELFNAHCEHIIAKLGLHEVHRRDRALACQADDHGVRVHLDQQGWVEARKVLFAIGASEQPYWPTWAQRHAKVQHIFDPAFDGWPKDPAERVAVIGGGISGAQVALRLVAAGYCVRLITRHEFRVHQFDTNPSWLRPRFSSDFDLERRASRRREIINRARHRGSIPPEIYRVLKRAIRNGSITWDRQEVADVIPSDDAVFVRFASGVVIETDRVLLATGYSSTRPGGELIDALIESAALPCAPCGYPIVDASLRWHTRVYVTGPLAELEIGPIARNIAGARAAGDRILAKLPRSL